MFFYIYSFFDIVCKYEYIKIVYTFSFLLSDVRYTKKIRVRRVRQNILNIF